MKIDDGRPQFTPKIITLETLEEVQIMDCIVHLVINLADSEIKDHIYKVREAAGRLRVEPGVLNDIDKLLTVAHKIADHFAHYPPL